LLKPKVVNCIVLKFALLSAFALPMYAGYIIPSVEWGSGSGTVVDEVNNYSGPFSCNVTASTANTCTESIASNQPPNFLHQPDGTASGTVSASTDANGAHLYAEAGTSGTASAQVTGYAQIYDTIYNNTNTAAKVQLTFHLDGSLYTRSSAVAFLDLEFNNASLFQAQQNYGGAGTYDFFDQDVTTALITVAANSHFNWNLVLSTSVTASSDAAAQYLAGLPTGTTDAGNTLSFTGISVFDAQGNPVASSGLTSYAGFDYTHSSTSAAPEPASLELFAGAVLLALGVKKRLKPGA
jgi:hypothetical protein